MTTENKTLLLIDGHSLALRSFFGIYTMAEKTGQHIFVRSDGQHTEAVHAFLSTLLSIIKDNQPSHIAVAFDLPGGTFRTAEYGEYKGGRNAIPEAFNGQIDLIKKMLGALNIPALTYENYEADDIVATLTRRGTEAGYKVLILSGDRDIFQLVTDDVTLLYPVTTGPSKGIQRMDPAAVEKKTKVPPHMYPDLAALTGEQADNLPGVPGVGPGFAAKWLGEYGSLQGVLDNRDKIGGKKGEALRENVDNVVRNRRLNQLVNDLDLNVTLEDTAFTPDLDALNTFFDEVEFRTIRKRAADTLGPIVRAAGTAGSASSTAEAGEEGATKKAPTGPVYAPIATSAPTKNADAAAFRAFCAAAAEENYGNDEQGAPIAVPERLEGAVTLYPVTNLPVARPAIGDAPAVKVTKTKIRAAEENPELLGVLLTSKNTSLWVDTRTIDPELDAALAAWLSDEAAAKSSWTSRFSASSCAPTATNSPAPSKTPPCPPTCAASSPPQPASSSPNAWKTSPNATSGSPRTPTRSSSSNPKKTRRNPPSSACPAKPNPSTTCATSRKSAASSTNSHACCTTKWKNTAS